MQDIGMDLNQAPARSRQTSAGIMVDFNPDGSDYHVETQLPGGVVY